MPDENAIEIEKNTVAVTSGRLFNIIVFFNEKRLKNPNRKGGKRKIKRYGNASEPR